MLSSLVRKGVGLGGLMAAVLVSRVQSPLGILDRWASPNTRDTSLLLWGLRPPTPAAASAAAPNAALVSIGRNFGHAALGVSLPVSAQRGATPSTDVCSPLAGQLGRLAAVVHRWSTAEPRASVVAVLGKGELWLALDTPRCCAYELACSGHSEVRDALLGRVGSQLFALNSERPSTRVGVSGANRLVRPFSPTRWAMFLRASGAIPTNEEQALEVASLVYLGAFPTVGRVEEVSGLGASFAQQAGALTSEPLVSRAVATDRGFGVTLWVSRHSHSGQLRDRGMGASRADDLRIAHLRIERSGRVVLLEDTPVWGEVGVLRGLTP